MVNIFQDPVILSFILSFSAFIFILTLVNIRVCILMLFFAVALSPKLNMGGIPLRVEDFFMIILCLSWLARLAINKEKLPSTFLDGPIIVYLIINLVVTIYGYIQGTTELLSSDPSISAAFHFLKKIQLFIMAYIIVANINSREDLIRNIKYVFYASTLLSIYGIQQGLSEYRISGPIGEGANTLGMYFVFVTIIAIGVFLANLPEFNKLFLGGSIVLYLYVILKSLSRVSYATFTIVILILGITKDRRLLMVFIVLLVAIALLAPPETVERISTLKGIFNSGEYFHSWEVRKEAWQKIPGQVFSESPLFGFGLASAHLCYAESGYMTDLYYSGLLGILGFFWLYSAIFKIGRNLVNSNDKLISTLAIYFLGGFLTFLIGGISGPTFIAIRTANIFWIFVGLLAGAENMLLRNETGNAATRQSSED